MGTLRVPLSLDVCGVFAEKKGSTVPIVVVVALAVVIASVLLATAVAFRSIPEITSSAVSRTGGRREHPADTTPLP